MNPLKNGKIITTIYNLNNRNILKNNLYFSGIQCRVFKWGARTLDSRTLDSWKLKSQRGHWIPGHPGVVWYSNGIQIPDHLAIGQLLAIQVPD